MTRSLYRKVTSRRRSLMGYSQLWLGEGHLLLVRSARLVENYKRFALQDIQAIVISDGPDLRAVQALAVAVSLGWAALALAMSSTFGQGFYAITGFFALALAIIDIARGPRCRCVLHTAVSTEPLPSVSRRNASWRFLSVVLPAIEAVQGPLELEQLQTASSQYVAQTSSPQAQPPEVKRSRSYVAEILFGMLVVDAALVWIVLRTSIPNAYGLLPTIYLAELILAGVTLAQRQEVKASILVWAAVSLVFIVADVTTVSGIGAWTAVMNAMKANANSGEPPAALSSLFLSARATAIFAASGRTVAGVVGLALCYFDRRDIAL
jgi:hypothetical protein